MSELRQNIVTGTWVAVSPGRARRPMDFDHGAPSRPSVPWSDRCPFCPGNEGLLPGVLWELAANAGPGWACRAVPNKYPAFRPGHDGEHDDLIEDPQSSDEARGALHGPRRPAGGRQEVIVENPRHDLDPARFDPPALRNAVDAWVERLGVHVAANPRGRVFLFRNHGRDAGASLEHGHAQLVSVDFVPPGVRRRERRMARFREERGEALLQAMLRDATERGLHVGGNDAFSAFVPWAAESPFETWIVPRAPDTHPARLARDGRDHLAELFGRLARAYRLGLGDAAYNVILAVPGAAPGVGWFVRLRPRLSRIAGFELASGVAINTSSPEADAESLRALVAAPPPSRSDP